MGTAYKHIIYGNRGIAEESKYPYTATYQGCQFKGGPVKIKSYTGNARYSCDGLISAVTDRAVSVALSASGWGSYSSGVFTACQTRVNHGVLLVGYTSAREWIIKNSWGSGWGDNGYIKLPAGDSCRICKYGGEWTTL